MLVGFRLCRSSRAFNDDDIFGHGVHTLTYDYGDFSLVLYGCGDKFRDPAQFGERYSLNAGGLDERNIRVTPEKSKVTIEADWLGSFPVFYDTETSEFASHWVFLDAANRRIDPIGSYILKKYSFIPTARTIKHNICRLLANEVLIWDCGALCVNQRKIEPFSIRPTTAAESLNLIEEYIYSATQNRRPVIPLSGGYDSRLIAAMLAKGPKSGIHAATYSLGNGDNDCFESVVSKEVSKRLGLKWTSYDLTGYSRCEDTILKWSGGFSHVNGDYYEKFASLIISDVDAGASGAYVLCSGIVGDAWSGKVRAKKPGVSIASDIMYSHGVRVYDCLFSEDERAVGGQAEEELESFFGIRVKSKADFLIELVRAKVPLLSFLCYAFERRGMPSVSPFLCKAVVLSMLGLPEQERSNRRWQNAFFRGLGISNTELPTKLLRVNSLAINEGLRKPVPRKLDALRADLKPWGWLVYRILADKNFRKVEGILQRRKIVEYLLRKLGYIRSDVVLSILNVVYK